jgi:hypothetical protein
VSTWSADGHIEWGCSDGYIGAAHCAASTPYAGREARDGRGVADARGVGATGRASARGERQPDLLLATDVSSRIARRQELCEGIAALTGKDRRSDERHRRRKSASTAHHNAHTTLLLFAYAAVLHPESPICSNSPGKYTVTGCPPTDRRLISNAPWTGRPFRSCTITPRTLACSAPTRAFAARGRPRARAARRRVL